MMHSVSVVFMCLVAAPSFVNSEFYSDIDHKEHDEAKALEIKAKHFWEGLMAGAQGLQATKNAELSARVEHALSRLHHKKDDTIRELFLSSTDHLAKADAMLFEEAARSKMLALQRLENGPSKQSLSVYVSDRADVLYTAYTKFVGYKTYETKLAHQIVERLKEEAPNLDRATSMAPSMYDESDKAEKTARAILELHEVGRRNSLRILALDIVSATGKQRSRFQDYLLQSLMVAAEDMAGEKEKATQTVMKASLRGATPAQSQKVAEPQGKPAYPLRHKDDEPPMVFHDGVPVDAVPIQLVF